MFGHSFFLSSPARKNRRTGAAFLPEPLLPRLSEPHAQRSDGAIINPDFQRKKFEHYPKNSTISQKTENHQKKAKAEYQMEGGAEFPPETPLPPRPHFCWPFWEFRKQMQKVRGAKKRGRGRVDALRGERD